jgi:hypothetical protein
VRVAGDVQIRAANIADQQRVAAEDEPGLVVAPAPVGNRVGVVRRRMARGRDRGKDGIAELHRITAGERDVRELHSCAGWQIGGRRAAFDERRQAGDVIRLHVRFDHGNDRRTSTFGLVQIRLDQRFVWINHRELALGQAAEQVRGACLLRVQERTQNHTVTLGRPGGSR